MADPMWRPTSEIRWRERELTEAEWGKQKFHIPRRFMLEQRWRTLGIEGDWVYEWRSVDVESLDGERVPVTYMEVIGFVDPPPPKPSKPPGRFARWQARAAKRGQ